MAGRPIRRIAERRVKAAWAESRYFVRGRDIAQHRGEVGRKIEFFGVGLGRGDHLRVVVHPEDMKRLPGGTIFLANKKQAQADHAASGPQINDVPMLATSRETGQQKGVDGKTKALLRLDHSSWKGAAMRIGVGLEAHGALIALPTES